MPTKSPPRAVARSVRRSWLLLSLALALLAGVSWRAWRLMHVPLDALVLQARQALAQGDPFNAETICRRVLDRDPDSAEALLLAGEAAAKQDRLEDAVTYYHRVPDNSGPPAAVARLASGDLLLHAAHAESAERDLRAALDITPDLALAHERLAWLLGVEGRRFEALPHVYRLLRQYRATLELLLAAGNHDVAFREQSWLEAFRRAEPDNPLPLIGLARIEMRRDHAQARRLLEQVRTERPGQTEAYALLGRVLWEEEDQQALARWRTTAPAAADGHPDVWLVRGQLAQRLGDTEAAARSFWEALRLDSNHQAATYQLLRTLKSFPTLPEGVTPEEIDFLARRSRQLEELMETFETYYARGGDPELVRRAAALSEALGRLWESWGWHRLAQASSPDAEWVKAGLARLEPQLKPELGETLASCNPAERLDLSDLPLPARPRSSGELASAPGTADERTGFSLPAFREVAGELGVQFTYYRGCEPDAGDGRMFEFTGGGVAVLDFDLDAWPDVYLTQGGRWPPQPGQREFLDQLFRNQGEPPFQRATEAAAIVEDRFSQGAAVGDFNADGFPDVYVANIGLNRLLMNCGDGTFLDATPTAGLQGEAWTTSCLMADLNGDGLADLYDVNYVGGEGVFDRTCDVGGKPRACQPSRFTPEADRLWLNLGDGRFADRSTESGIALPGGNGLGIVAADFQGEGRLSLFVANDQDANFYFVNHGTEHDGSPRFNELGVVSGLAYDAQGKAQACMGVAAGDANGDGALDLFVTNFYQESNTLYLQQTPELFDDASAAAGLREPSLNMLGFGTQFLDGELDGLPDFVLVNGHIDDFRHVGSPYAMRPQYFRNQGDARFAELPGERLGTFFEQPGLGRGLARLDVNRDGRDDFAVSHLDAPAALLVNETLDVGHFFALRLTGVKTSRDAIGTRVTLVVDGRSQTQQLTAGDGYMASNQRQLLFGLGKAQTIDELRIDWPSGKHQVWRQLGVDQELLAVEGRQELTRVPR